MFHSSQYWILLGLAVPAFWLVPARFRSWLLGIVSITYLATLSPFSTAALALWTVLFFYLAPHAQKGAWGGRRLLSVLVLAILGFLAYFKYVPPLLEALSSGRPSDMLLIPLGISYYTFKLIHYAVETARGNIKQRSLGDFVSYMFLFPIFTAGPIERFDHYLAQRATQWCSADMVEGLSRIIQGLVKRFVLAAFIEFHALDRLTSEELVLRPDGYSTPLVWIYFICFYLHVYLDFSAYSDIAIGSSRLFGLKIMENFNWPIFARNFSDFWKRWHMSLGAWCQAYVYMPLLGLYRRPYLSMFGSFIAFAMWHEGSLSRLAWGLFHGVGVSLHVYWTRRSRMRGAPPKPPVWQAAVAWFLPQLWMILASAFVIASEGGEGLGGALRLLAKLAGFDVR